MFIIRSKRLILRHFQIADAEALHHAIFADPDVMHFGDGVQSLGWTYDWTRARIEHDYPIRGFGPYAVVERQEQRLIGYCGLFYHADVNGRSEVEIGYRLARAAWGHGYATEAAQLVRDHAFGALGMKRLTAIIDPANTSSIRVAEKIRMHYEADVMFEGYSHPDHVYVIARS